MIENTVNLQEWESHDVHSFSCLEECDLISMIYVCPWLTPGPARVVIYFVKKTV